MAERQATAVWEGDLGGGKGTVSSGSGVLSEQPITWEARTGQHGGLTSPEELIAAAHASCYAMAFSHTLAEQGMPPERLEVASTVGFVPKPGGGMMVGYANLSVTGRVPGMADQAAFEAAARQGEANCPISNALRNNVQINLKSTLDNG